MSSCFFRAVSLCLERVSSALYKRREAWCSVTTKSHIAELLAILQPTYPDAHCALEFTTPLELLIATILSAQCTDERVNLVTRTLFQCYRTIEDYATADLEELARAIQSTGFYRQKARSIQRCCDMLLRQCGGSIPETMEALVSLPGVGRKTANVILGNALHRPQGIAVDTHVKRLAQRLGLTTETNPDKIEQDLMVLVPQEAWTLFSHLLILHGRTLCKARAPQCAICPVQHLCPTSILATGRQKRRDASVGPDNSMRYGSVS
jgi:endonuclease-3